MADFLTEKAIEDYLTSETRDVALPNGRTEVVTATKLFWTQLDLLIEARITTLDDLIRLTHLDKRDTSRDFATSFQSVVAYVDRHAG